MAARDIVISYSIFQTLFNAPVLEGREEVENFVKRFAGKWQDREMTIQCSGSVRIFRCSRRLRRPLRRASRRTAMKMMPAVIMGYR